MRGRGSGLGARGQTPQCTRASRSFPRFFLSSFISHGLFTPPFTLVPGRHPAHFVSYCSLWPVTIRSDPGTASYHVVAFSVGTVNSLLRIIQIASQLLGKADEQGGLTEDAWQERGRAGLHSVVVVDQSQAGPVGWDLLKRRPRHLMVLCNFQEIKCHLSIQEQARSPCSPLPP